MAFRAGEIVQLKDLCSDPQHSHKKSVNMCVILGLGRWRLEDPWSHRSANFRLSERFCSTCEVPVSKVERDRGRQLTLTSDPYHSCESAHTCIMHTCIPLSRTYFLLLILTEISCVEFCLGATKRLCRLQLHPQFNSK